MTSDGQCRADEGDATRGCSTTGGGCGAGTAGSLAGLDGDDGHAAEAMNASNATGEGSGGERQPDVAGESHIAAGVPPKRRGEAGEAAGEGSRLRRVEEGEATRLARAGAASPGSSSGDGVLRASNTKAWNGESRSPPSIGHGSACLRLEPPGATSDRKGEHGVTPPLVGVGDALNGEKKRRSTEGDGDIEGRRCGDEHKAGASSRGEGKSTIHSSSPSAWPSAMAPGAGNRGSSGRARATSGGAPNVRELFPAGSDRNAAAARCDGDAGAAKCACPQSATGDPPGDGAAARAKGPPAVESARRGEAFETAPGDCHVSADASGHSDEERGLEGDVGVGRPNLGAPPRPRSMAVGDDRHEDGCGGAATNSTCRAPREVVDSPVQLACSSARGQGLGREGDDSSRTAGDCGGDATAGGGIGCDRRKGAGRKAGWRSHGRGGGDGPRASNVERGAGSPPGAPRRKEPGWHEASASRSGESLRSAKGNAAGPSPPPRQANGSRASS